MNQSSFKVNIQGRTLTLEKKTKILDLIEGNKKDYIYCKVNNILRELTYEVFYDAEVVLLTKKDHDSGKVYETSLRYIVAMAANNVFPNIPIKFTYNISRSIFMVFPSDPTGKQNFRINLALLAKLKDEIDRIVKEDYPFKRRIVTNEEAKEIYKKYNLLDKIEILKYRPEKTVHLYECNGYLNYMYGHMVPSTGHITDYKLMIYGHGVLIQYPRSETNGEIPPFVDAPVFSKTLRESYTWAKQVKTDSVASINKFALEDGPIDFINMCEQHHNNMLSELGQLIGENSESIRLICVAGPSSSGKTTFANRLRTELLSLGLRPIRISLDNYYLAKDKVPLGEDGTPDFECLESLNLDLINRNILDLIDGQEVRLPVYNFKTGETTFKEPISISPNQPIIIEGIHALNEALTSQIPAHQKFRIFIAPQAQVNVDNTNPISLTDLRLVRRIVRDYQFRNSSAEETLSMWNNVREGEFKWIYDTQENADYVFNSLLPCELCINKKYALPLLTAIPKDSIYYTRANRLIKFLKLFVDMDDKWVPCNSILREFIGGSCFQDV